MNYGLGGQKGSLTLTKVGPLFNVVNSCIHLDTATIRIQEEKREGKKPEPVSISGFDLLEYRPVSL